MRRTAWEISIRVTQEAYLVPYNVWSLVHPGPGRMYLNMAAAIHDFYSWRLDCFKEVPE